MESHQIKLMIQLTEISTGDKIGGILTLLVFWTAGVVLTLWPRKVQGFYVHFLDQHQKSARLVPFVEWMKTSSYVTCLRVIGVVCFTVSAILTVGFVIVLRRG